VPETRKTRGKAIIVPSSGQYSLPFARMAQRPAAAHSTGSLMDKSHVKHPKSAKTTIGNGNDVIWMLVPGNYLQIPW